MPSKIRIVNRHHGEPFDIYIGRGSKWGNPFSHQAHPGVKVVFGTREEALEAYELYARSNPVLLESLKELDGKVLGCSCVPRPCHGQILKKLRDEQL